MCSFVCTSVSCKRIHEEIARLKIASSMCSEKVNVCYLRELAIVLTTRSACNRVYFSNLRNSGTSNRKYACNRQFFDYNFQN